MSKHPLPTDPQGGPPPGSEGGTPGYPPLYGGVPSPYYYGTQSVPGGVLGTLLGDLTPSRLLRIVRVRWLTLLLAAGFGVLAAYHHLSKKIPVYQATATIEMSVRRPRIMTAEGAVRNEDWIPQADEFNTRMEKFRGKRMRDLAKEMFREMPEAPELSDSELAGVLGGVGFSLIRDSRLVKVDVAHPDPVIAAFAVNACAQAARQMAVNENRIVSDDAVAWLRSQATAQRELVDKADQAMVDFRKDNQIAALENEAASITGAIAALNQNAVQAKSQADVAQSLLEAIESNPLTPDTIGKLPSNVPRLGEISSAIQAWAQAVQDCDALLLKYTEEHPRVKTQQELIGGLRGQVGKAATRARETALSDLSLAVQTVKTLDARKAELDRQHSELELKIIELKAKLASLERERNAADLSFQGILRRIEEARLAADEETTTIQIAELAGIPTAPVFRNRNRILAIGAVLGLCVGMGLALLKDVVDDHIISPLDVELGIGVDVLGAIPKVKGKYTANELDCICLHDKSGHTAELFAGIRSVLDLPPLDAKTDRLVVTSTQPGEGKTFNAINLAIMSARAGRKTLLIDFDLRRPRLRTVFDLPEQHPSLMHVLHKKDEGAFPSLPFPTQCPNLDVVGTTADSAISPAEVLGNRIVDSFVDWAAQHYERIIFDSPPLGVLADSMVLSGICKGVVLVCHPGKTKRAAMRHIVRRFQKVNGNIVGVIINNIDLGHGEFRKYQHYGYGYGHNYGYGKS